MIIDIDFIDIYVYFTAATSDSEQVNNDITSVNELIGDTNIEVDDIETAFKLPDFKKEKHTLKSITGKNLDNWKSAIKTVKQAIVKKAKYYLSISGKANSSKENPVLLYWTFAEQFKAELFKVLKIKSPFTVNNTDSIFGNTRPYHFLRCPNPTDRLGNLLFDFAATLGIAHTLNYKPIIHPWHPLNYFFDLGHEYVSDRQLDNVIPIYHEQWENYIRRNGSDFLSHNLTLTGYFQSWKHFEDIKDTVRKAFSFKLVYIMTAQMFVRANAGTTKTLIGVHVRRGDFLLQFNKDIGRIVASRKYMEKSLRYFRKRYKDAHFIVVSDDIEWCKENVLGPDVTYSPFKEDFIDMAILSLCDHVIKTVGTFGWWGGWLAGGTVVYLKDYPRAGSALDENGQFKANHFPPHWIGLTND